eukprot:1144357-Pelagomonas_calceolata.AAC.3
MICWADMLQAPTCTELCISKLADNFRPGSAKDVNGMLEGLPESVLELPSFAKVCNVCWSSCFVFDTPIAREGYLSLSKSQQLRVRHAN